MTYLFIMTVSIDIDRGGVMCDEGQFYVWVGGWGYYVLIFV